MVTGEDDKYNTIFSEYYNGILKLISKRVHNYDLAQDICQETFIRLYANIDDIDEVSVKGWLIVTARNIAIDLNRRSKHIEYLNVYDEKDSEAFDHIIKGKAFVESEYNEKLRKEFRIKILKHIQSVNKDWHTIIEYTVMLDKSQDEIARQMGISKEVLRGKLFRARKWIKKEYGGEYDDLKD